MFGSVPLKTYLPDGDIDLSIFCPADVAKALHTTWTARLQAVLEQEQRNAGAPHRVGEVTVINAEVKPFWGVARRGAARAAAAALGEATSASARGEACCSCAHALCVAQLNPTPQTTQVKLLKCVVDDVVVDVSFNQLGGLVTLNFLESVDAALGRDNLFKRALLLVRLRLPVCSRRRCAFVSGCCSTSLASRTQPPPPAKKTNQK